MFKALLYRWYERRLIRTVISQPLPKHIGIILDGNRRHAQGQGVTDPRTIYDLGAKKLSEFLDWLLEMNIPAVTLWVLSTDNLHRPPEELAGIFEAIERTLTSLAADPRIHAHHVRIEAVGHLDRLPTRVRDAIRAAEQATRAHRTRVLTFAVLYGGREEIVDAVRAVVAEQMSLGKFGPDLIEAITSESISRHLYTFGLPDPELLIRTSGEVRLSGFLLWQSASSEFYFCDVNWPALRRIDILRAMRSFQMRQRRYGR